MAGCGMSVHQSSDYGAVVAATVVGMSEAGDPRPPRSTPPAAPGHPGSAPSRFRPQSLAAALVEALAVALVAALAWGVLKGILELGVGLLAVAVAGGWAIGAVMRMGRGSPLLAIGIAMLAWLGGLLCTWLIAMAILPGSARSFFERIAATPFLDWLSPQFGLVEIAGLVVYMAAAAYGARRSG